MIPTQIKATLSARWIGLFLFFVPMAVRAEYIDPGFRNAVWVFFVLFCLFLLTPTLTLILLYGGFRLWKKFSHRSSTFTMKRRTSWLLFVLYFVGLIVGLWIGFGISFTWAFWVAILNQSLLLGFLLSQKRLRPILFSL